MEPIHVELPYEWLEVRVLKVAGEYLFCKCLMIMNDESIALCVPADYVLKTVILLNNSAYFKDLVGF